MARMPGRAHRPNTCKYGCCRDWHTPHSKTGKKVRSQKAREKQIWKKESKDN